MVNSWFDLGRISQEQTRLLPFHAPSDKTRVFPVFEAELASFQDFLESTEDSFELVQGANCCTMFSYVQFTVLWPYLFCFQCSIKCINTCILI